VKSFIQQKNFLGGWRLRPAVSPAEGAPGPRREQQQAQCRDEQWASEGEEVGEVRQEGRGAGQRDRTTEKSALSGFSFYGFVVVCFVFVLQYWGLNSGPTS
jgi:hypothetical protein